MNTHIKAAHNSLNAAFSAFDQSPLDSILVAYCVGMQRAEDERLATSKDPSQEDTSDNAKRSSTLLGCYVNGKLRFQSRDHEAIWDYAERHMNGAKNFGNDVWVAPVGSFVTEDVSRKNTARKLNKVHKAA